VARYDAWDAAVRYAGAADNLLDMLGIERSRTVGDDLPTSISAYRAGDVMQEPDTESWINVMVRAAGRFGLPADAPAASRCVGLKHCR
jgi:hypothetical protein